MPSCVNCLLERVGWDPKSDSHEVSVPALENMDIDDMARLVNNLFGADTEPLVDEKAKSYIRKLLDSIENAIKTRGQEELFVTTSEKHSYDKAVWFSALRGFSDDTMAIQKLIIFEAPLPYIKEFMSLKENGNGIVFCAFESAVWKDRVDILRWMSDRYQSTPLEKQYSDKLDGFLEFAKNAYSLESIKFIFERFGLTFNDVKKTKLFYYAVTENLVELTKWLYEKHNFKIKDENKKTKMFTHLRDFGYYDMLAYLYYIYEEPFTYDAKTDPNDINLIMLYSQLKYKHKLNNVSIEKDSIEKDSIRKTHVTIHVPLEPHAKLTLGEKYDELLIVKSDMMSPYTVLEISAQKDGKYVEVLTDIHSYDVQEIADYAKFGKI